MLSRSESDLQRIGKRARKIVALPQDEAPAGGDVAVGMRADAVLLLPGRGKEDAVRKPRKAGQLVEWYYRDCTITLHFERGHWRVKEIKQEVDSR